MYLKKLPLLLLAVGCVSTLMTDEAKAQNVSVLVHSVQGVYYNNTATSTSGVQTAAQAQFDANAALFSSFLRTKGIFATDAWADVTLTNIQISPGGAWTADYDVDYYVEVRQRDAFDAIWWASIFF